MSTSARARILPPYTRRVDDVLHRSVRLLAGAALVLFAMAMGFFIALFGTFGWFIYAIPLVLLFLTALWLAPDVDTRLDGAIERTWFILMGLFLMWPTYIAFNLPGVPWISFERLAMFTLAVLTLYAMAISSRVRGELAETLTANRLIFRLFALWVAIQFVMMLVALGDTFGRYLDLFLFWNFLFLMSAWMMRKEGNATRLFRLILIGTVVVGVFAILEVREGKPIWTDHIPGFLGINPDILQTLNEARQRGGAVRATGIYLTAVTYAEFIAMAVPVFLFAVMHAPTVRRFVVALGLLYLLFHVGLLTGSRTAMVGFTVAIPAFLGIWALRRFVRESARRDIIGPAFVWLAPVLLAGFAAAILFVGRIRVRVLGGSAHQRSNEGRERQWEMALPEIIQNPLGYGLGKIESVVPFYNYAGVFTIDSYPIILLVEYGVLGFLVFVGLMLACIYWGVRIYIRADRTEEMLAGAFAVSLLVFLVTRTVVATGPTPTLAFALCGMIAGLYWRMRAQFEDRPEPDAPVPLRPTPFVPGRGRLRVLTRLPAERLAR